MMPAQIALYIWPVIILLVGRYLGWRHAACWALLGGFVLLPVNGVFAWPKTPHAIDKYVVAGLMAMVCCAMYVKHTTFKQAVGGISWLDLLVVVLCLTPIVSALANNLSIMDEGIARSWQAIVFWLIPWCVGRCFGDRDNWHILWTTVLILGVLYVPICLYEMIAGPKGYLGTVIYGYEYSYGTVEGHSYRLGGWRPIGFFENGVRLGRWMAVVVLFAGSLVIHRFQQRKAVWHWMLFSGFTIVTVLCRSLSWLVFLSLGLVVLAMWRWLAPKTTVLIIALLLTAPLGYMLVRTTGLWNGDQLIQAAQSINQKRAQSLAYRRDSENVYIERTLDHSPWVGYGGSWRWFKYPRVADQRWIVTFGNNGLLGLVSWYGIFYLPAIIAICRFRNTLTPDGEANWLLLPILLCTLALLDGMINALGNPIFVISSGVLASVLIKSSKPSAAL